MRKAFQKIVDETQAARDRLKAAIKALPESAEGVRLLSKNCGVVPFSLIASHGLRLDPKYWLARETKAELLQLVDSKRTTETLVGTLQEIVNTGRLPNGTQIPPNIIIALKEAWENE